MLWLRMARQLNINQALLGYRLLVNGAVAERNSISGRDFAWENVDGILRGYATFLVPDGSILQCFASYAGIARHYYWVGDPSIVQNPRRAVYELFDNGLNILQKFLQKDRARAQEARDFEVSVA